MKFATSQFRPNRPARREGVQRAHRVAGGAYVARIACVMCSVLAVLLGLACAPSTQRNEEPYAFAEVLGLALFGYAESGQCLQSTRSADELGILTCAPVPRTACEITRKPDRNGAWIVTEGTRNRYLQLWAGFQDDYPLCDEAIALAAVQPAFRETPAEELESRRENNRLQVTASCALTENQDLDKLVTRGEYDFAFSARGVLASQALFLADAATNPGGSAESREDAARCYASLTTPTERTLLEAIRDGERITETRCFYGQTAASPFGPDPECGAAEKELAHPFDFTTPL